MMLTSHISENALRFLTPSHACTYTHLTSMFSITCHQLNHPEDISEVVTPPRLRLLSPRSEAKPSHAILILPDQTLTVFLRIVALGEEHTFVSFGFFVLAHAAWLQEVSIITASE
jgi:hypothetical protein